jgi:hypothetical protein
LWLCAGEMKMSCACQRGAHVMRLMLLAVALHQVAHLRDD